MTLSSTYKSRVIKEAIRKSQEVAVEVTGDPAVAELIDPTVNECRRKSSVAGRSINGQIVELNVLLLTTKEIFKETLYHELAQLVCYHCYGRGTHHGKQWREVMDKFGFSPDRCHKIDLSEIMPDRWKSIRCEGCGSKVVVSIRIRNRMRTENHRYTCRLCGGRVIL